MRLWCLIAQGFTDIETDYRATKRDWSELRKSQKAWDSIDGHWREWVNSDWLLPWRKSWTGRTVDGWGAPLDMASGDNGGQIIIVNHSVLNERGLIPHGSALAPTCNLLTKNLVANW